MPKKGKKVPFKRGKPSSKHAKKLSKSEAQLPTSSQEHEEPPPDTDGPSTSKELPPAVSAGPSTSKELPPAESAEPSTSNQKSKRPLLPLPPPPVEPKSSGMIVKRCEQIERLADSIRKRCKVTTHKECFMNERPENVQELEFLVSEIKKLAQNAGVDMPPPPIPTAPRPKTPTDPVVFQDQYKYLPRTKTRMPYIYLHAPTDFRKHAREVLTRNIKIYWPDYGKHYTRILCPTSEDHEKFIQYAEEKELPYHSYDYPSKKMLKVVVNGIPMSVDLNKLKEELIAVSIPVVRLNEMNPKLEKKGRFRSVLVTVPDNDDGRKLLKVKVIFGQYVRIEPPLPKSKLCHRCQKWGHSQLHCRGLVRCVRCAGPHFSNECPRDPVLNPLRCANCGNEHATSYRRCPHCPDSKEYKKKQKNKKVEKLPMELLTLEDCPPIEETNQ